MALPRDLVKLLLSHITIRYWEQQNSDSIMHVAPYLNLSHISKLLGELPELTAAEQIICALTQQGQVGYQSQLFLPHDILGARAVLFSTPDEIIIDLIGRSYLPLGFTAAFTAAIKAENYYIAAWFAPQDTGEIYTFLELQISGYFPQPFTKNYFARLFALQEGATMEPGKLLHSAGAHFIERLNNDDLIRIDDSPQLHDDLDYENLAIICNIPTTSTEQNEEMAFEYLAYRCIKVPSGEVPDVIINILAPAVLQERAGPMRDFVLQHYADSDERQLYLAQLDFILAPTTAATTSVYPELLVLFNRLDDLDFANVEIPVENYFSLALLGPRSAVLACFFTPARLTQMVKLWLLRNLLAAAAVRNDSEFFARAYVYYLTAQHDQITRQILVSRFDRPSVIIDTLPAFRIFLAQQNEECISSNSFLLQYCQPDSVTFPQYVDCQFGSNVVIGNNYTAYEAATWRALGFAAAEPDLEPWQKHLQLVQALLRQ